jgi:hypothetical protein
MPAWSTPADIRSQLQKKWDSGQILAAFIHGDTLFPMKIPLRHPTARAIGSQFDEVRLWIASLSGACKTETGSGFGLEWRETSHRQLGKNQLPVAAMIESEADALSIIGKQKQADQFKIIVDSVITSFAELAPWLQKRPLKALKHTRDWPYLLSVLQWISRHPRPGIYIRQIDLPGVHSKFIESHKSLLIELLDIILPDDAIDFAATGAREFEQRYGFRSKPVQVRLRLLDPNMSLQGLTDLAVPAAELARLQLPVTSVFITENDINGLAFPAIEKCMVIFGLGYGLQVLKQIDWLNHAAIYYWGDIDTHGFAMLDQLRQYFPHTESLLMDEETLLAHRPLWGEENKPTSRDLDNLQSQEQDLYQKIISDRYSKNLRLEQERIGFSYLEAALSPFQLCIEKSSRSEKSAKI